MVKEWLKIDAHVHSKGVSRCSAVSVEQIVEEKKFLGYDGAILVNHCQPWYYPPQEHSEFIGRILAEYALAQEAAKAMGFAFWLGLEVSINEPFYSDWLLYGATEEFLLKTPCLYQLSQKELFHLCEANGVLLVQAHPYRQQPADPKYMHGVEINCTSGDLEKRELVEAFAKEHALMITCGTDYHKETQTYRGGMFVPARCRSAADFAKYLRSAKETRVFLGEREKLYPKPVFKKE